ncbi:MAG TPA: hypothetical protein VEC14_01575 [Reyranellaceae bacterium]|nr:hypothetical protein [Reyranellaceae bacterium]
MSADFPLTREQLADALRAMPGERLLLPDNKCECPIAAALRDCGHGGQGGIAVDMFHADIDGVVVDLPQWARDFVHVVDAVAPAALSPAEALAMLEQVPA